MSGQKNNQHPFGSTCCRQTYGWMGLDPRRDWMGLDGIGLDVDESQEWLLCATTVCNPLCSLCQRMPQWPKGLQWHSAPPTSAKPPSFNRRHREKVFLCVIYQGGLWIKYQTWMGQSRHQIEKFTPTPFQPFQRRVPSVWTSRRRDPYAISKKSAESFVCLLAQGRSLCSMLRGAKERLDHLFNLCHLHNGSIWINGPHLVSTKFIIIERHTQKGTSFVHWFWGRRRSRNMVGRMVGLEGLGRHINGFQVGVFPVGGTSAFWQLRQMPGRQSGQARRRRYS